MSEEKKVDNENKTPEKLLFAKNEVVKQMKWNLDDDKMIMGQVKVEMNRFIYSICVRSAVS